MTIPSSLDQLRVSLDHTSVRALGEIGLDYLLYQGISHYRKALIIIHEITATIYIERLTYFNSPNIHFSKLLNICFVQSTNQISYSYLNLFIYYFCNICASHYRQIYVLLIHRLFGFNTWVIEF